MNATLHFSPRRLVLIGLVGLVAVLTLGFAAANTVPGSNAGDGSGTVSGYTVSNIHYTLDTTNPANTTQLGFTLSPALSGSGTSRLSLNGGTSWLAAGACTGTTNVTCTAAVAVTSLTSLRIVAAD